MTWTVTGPDGLEFRHDDALTLALASGLGLIRLTPHVLARDSAGATNPDLSDLEDFHLLQLAIQDAGLPWLSFVVVEGRRHDGSIPMSADADPDDLPAIVIQVVSQFADTVREVLARHASGPVDIAELAVSLRWRWDLTPDEVPALLGLAGLEPDRATLAVGEDDLHLQLTDGAPATVVWSRESSATPRRRSTGKRSAARR